MSCNICSSTSNDEITTHCGHKCCTSCFKKKITSNPFYPVECFQCSQTLTDGECLKYFSSEQETKYLNSKTYLNEILNETILKCFNIDCDGKIENVNVTSSYRCLACNKVNCMHCRTIHQDGEDCDQWHLNNQHKIDEEKQKQILIDKKINEKTAMYCVKCGTLCERNGGCYGVKCLICKTALCFITQKARWGPQGVGDLSSGCMCSPNRKCHESCYSCT